jgi:P-type conjugative transfer protein TrbJ
MRAGKRAMATALVVLVATMVPAPVPVRAGTWTGASTEWTQISNNIQLLQHTISLIQTVMNLKRQVEYMARNAKNIDSPESFLRTMGSVGGLINQMRGILFASESIVDRWKQTHPGHKDLEQYYSTPADAYTKIDESTRQAVQRSMEVLDLQANSVDGWPQDRTILAELKDKAQTVSGQLQAAKVTNDLLIEVVRQLHLLRGVQIAHAEMMGYHISGETQRRQFEDKHMRSRALDGYSGRYRGDGVVDPSRTTW